MRLLAVTGLIFLSSQFVLCQNFSGLWKLDESKSTIRSRFDIPWGFLRVSQTSGTMTVSASTAEGQPATTILYPIGRSEKSQAGDLTFDAVTKWEGGDMIANIEVTGQFSYRITERWERHNGLTITRTIDDRGTRVDSVLVYANTQMLEDEAHRPAPLPVSPPAPPATGGLKLRPPEPAPDQEFVLQPGTRILLRLTNAVNTKYSRPGDKIYLQTAAPVFLNGHLVIPQGAYVTGTVTESERAGRVKGKSSINFRFETLTLPNGVTRDFLSRAGSVDTKGSLDREEGKITGDGTVGKDAGAVAKTTAAGTGVGTIAGAASGNLGMGMGVGAAAGAVAGLAHVLTSRGNEVVIPQGATMEMVLDRELRYTGAELSGQAQ